MLRSPLTGRALQRVGHVLQAGEERWPVVDDIAFLRAGRRDLADTVLARQDEGDHEGALVLLLGDQDDWARTPPPDTAARLHLLRRHEALSFREAMDLLAFGPVGTYFAHRWSDPTYLSGLALAQAHWQQPRRVLEVACGVGHFLRAFASPATDVVGGDVVFAKLWLAHHFVAPEATLVCFDAAAGWPFADGFADLLFCHDALYFLPNKPSVAIEMMRCASRILVGHVHNALVDNLSAGQPLPPDGYAALLPGCSLFDDRELTSALIERRVPGAAAAADLQDAPALALSWGNLAAGVACGALTQPQAGRMLRRNPLYRSGEIVWPSDRYQREYGALATYPARIDAPETAYAGETDGIDGWARSRVLLDLPDRW